MTNQEEKEENKCTPATCPFADGAVWGINPIALENYRVNHEKNHK